LGPTELKIMNEGPSQPQHPSAGLLSRDEVPWLDLVKGHENQLRYALAVIRRRRGVILATIVLVTVGTLLLMLQQTPVYTASALLMLNTRGANVVNVAAVVAGLPPDTNAIRSEIDVLESRALAARVIADLGLAGDSEFAPPPSGNGLLAMLNPLSWMPREWRRVLAGAAPEPTATQAAAIAQSRTIDNFLRQLKVTNDLRSFSVTVSFQSRDPDKAARIANAIAERYIDNQLQLKLDATTRANAWLTDRLSELREKLRQSQQKVEDFKAQSNLIETTGQTLDRQQLGELNSQLVLVRAERAKLESELAQLKALEAGGGLDHAPELLASPMILRLRDQEATLLSRQAELSQGQSGRELAAVGAAVAMIRTSIALDGKRIIAATDSQLAAVKQRETTFAGYIDALRGEVVEQSRAQVRLAELQRDADADRAILETFLTRSKETAGQNAFEQPDARIISPADLPVRPSSPHVRTAVAVAFGASILLGILLAFVIESLQSGFRFPEEVERFTDTRVLRVVPDLPGSIKGRLKAHDFVLREPNSAYAEALQAVRTNLRFATAGGAPRIVLLTSGTVGEAKSTLALSLARLAARAGQRTLLIDADMRRPAIADLMKLRPAKGLEDLLSGQATLAEVIVKDEATGLEIIPSRAGASQPQDLLSGPRMSELIHGLRQAHDLVIIDSPPVTFVSDAVIMSGLVDFTLYLIRWEATPRETAQAGLMQLRRSGASAVGVVLTRARLRRHEAYGYGTDTGYYGTAPRTSA
jgi:succinoglycan biosynthesis transport protein ExoP